MQCDSANRKPVLPFIGIAGGTGCALRQGIARNVL